MNKRFENRKIIAFEAALGFVIGMIVFRASMPVVAEIAWRLIR